MVYHSQLPVQQVVYQELLCVGIAVTYFVLGQITISVHHSGFNPPLEVNLLLRGFVPHWLVVKHVPNSLLDFLGAYCDNARAFRTHLT